MSALPALLLCSIGLRNIKSMGKLSIARHETKKKFMISTITIAMAKAIKIARFFLLHMTVAYSRESWY